GAWRCETPAVDLTIPESLSKMIEALVERLSTREQAVLEAASAVGISFTVPVVAEEGDELRECEECCDGLARRNLFIYALDLEETPGHSMSAGYRFTHALYREVLYRR